MYSVPKLAEKYFKYMKSIKGRQNSTLNQYSFDLNKFFQFTLKMKNKDIEVTEISNDFIKTITETDIINYIESIDNTSESTRIARIATLKSFFNYVHKKAKLININPALDIDSPKKHRKLPKYIETIDKQLELLNSVDGKFKERDKAIISLFLNTGIRLTELVDLDLDSIHGDELVVLHGKGDKPRIIPLNDACLACINEYLNIRPSIEDQALFLSVTKNYKGIKINRISAENVRRLNKKYLTKVGLSDLSTHKLRHTAATRWQDSGLDIRQIQELLGHESISTTQIYTHVNKTKLKEAVNQSGIG